MCGRFALYRSLEEIKEAFSIQQVNLELEPSYNVAPTQDVAVVVQREEGNTLEKMRWGLIPFWAKDPSIGSRMINARSETVHEKNSFKRPLKSQRCLIIADGFFEWQKTWQSKVPMFIQLKSKRPFGFAGLYDVWKSPEGEAITSCTIITTDANDFIPSNCRVFRVDYDAILGVIRNSVIRNNHSRRIVQRNPRFRAVANIIISDIIIC